MKKLDEQSIRNFVYYDSWKSIQPNSLGIALWYGWPFALFGCFFCGVILGGVYLFLGACMVFVTLIYVTLSFVLKRKMNSSLKAGLFCNSILSVYSALLFLLLSLILIIMANPSMLVCTALVILYLLSISIYFYLVTRMMIKGSTRTTFPGKVAAASVGGCVVGTALAQTFLSEANQDTALSLTYLCFFILTLIFSFGFINIPKLYLCIKYDVPDIIFAKKKATKKKARKKLPEQSEEN